MRRGLSIGLALVVAACGGCVRRTIVVTSDPPGALVHLNDREVGRTPVTVDFVYYGDYDVRLERAGYEPLVTHAEASPPWWDAPGPDLLAEVTPGEKHVVIRWHFDLEPSEADAAGTVERALELREAIAPAEAGDEAAGD